VTGDAARAREIADRSIDARVCCTEAYTPCQTEGWRQALAKDIRAAIDAAEARGRAAEREECAVVAETFSRMMGKPDHADAAKLIAIRIRDRALVEKKPSQSKPKTERTAREERWFDQDKE
jgi:hypothetical protein